MGVVNLKSSEFEKEVLKADLPVLVDFWAEWCGPCRMVGPIVDEIAKDLQGKLKVVKVNVDDAHDLAGKYRIMSIPTLMIFKGGEVIEQMVGAMSKDNLRKRIDAKI